ncbi:MAG TPA: Crp/Fnr family transcriptional regulator [Bacillota bacterium]|nr:Crp/Fnr family transcriptional regulator [Bacillota bacterium]
MIRSTSQMPSYLIESLKQISTPKQYKKGSLLFSHGTKADHLYLILSGKVKLLMTTPDGKEIILSLAQANDLVGESALFVSQTMHTYSVQALTRVQVGLIQKNTLEEELYRSTKLTDEFLKWMGTRNCRMQLRIRDLLLKGKQGALYSTLIRMANSYGRWGEKDVTIELPITIKDLAGLTGMQRESVSRLMKELREKEIITINDGYITIHQINLLRTSIDCETCPLEYCQI